MKKEDDIFGGFKPVSNDSCQTNQLSLANNACVIGGDPNNDSSGGSNVVCIGETCVPEPPILSDPNMIWYLAVGLVFIGIIAMALKKRR